MASRWPSATKDLRLRITWRFAFVPMGTVADPSPDAVYLEVGGKYFHGVVDHHQGNDGACSATRQLVKRPDLVYDHLVGPWHASHARGAGLQQGTIDPLVADNRLAFQS